MEHNPEAKPVGLDYWLQWQVPVCALIFIIPLVISLNLIIKGRRRVDSKDDFRPSDLWVPCWINLHPKWLLFYRAFAFISMAYLLYETVVGFGPFVFFFYTQWTFVLVMVYFAIATIISARGCWMYSKKPFARNAESDKFLKKDFEENGYESTTNIRVKQTPGDQRAGVLENLMQSIYHACGGAVMLTDLVFWLILVPLMVGEEFKLTLLIGFMHSLNVVFLLLDSAFNSLPFPWHRLTYFVLWSCAYIVFQWTIHAFGVTWWPYPFLELSTPWAPAWYFGIALFHIPCYGLYVLLLKVKDSIFSFMFPHAFVRVSVEKKQT